MTDISLSLDAYAADKNGVVNALQQEATAFFAGEKFYLSGPVTIDTDAPPTDGNQAKWHGSATYTNVQPDPGQ